MTTRAIRTLHFSLVAAAAAGLAACPGPVGPDGDLKVLIDPHPDAYAAAQAFRSAHPGSRIFFSQTSGEVMMVDGAGNPLASGSASDAASAMSLVASFIGANPALFRVSGSADTFRYSSDAYRAAPRSRGSFRFLRFEQTRDGLPVRGRYGLATFNASGRLIALLTKLTPSEELDAGDDGGIGVSRQALTVAGAPHLDRPRPGRPRHVIDTLDGSTYQVLEERLERRGGERVRELRDARGTLLERVVEMPSALVAPPSGWASSGSFTRARARDSLGQEVAIPSTDAGSALVLGFTLEGILGSGKAVTIADASGGDPRIVPETPLATDASDWTAEPAYEPSKRAATRLATNLETTLRWLADMHGYLSWDGQGSSFHAAIGGNRAQDPTSPDVAAYGWDGYMLIGNGQTTSGQYLSDALDVVAHELTHSIVTATADFAYQDEPGALTESLADVFGKSVQGFPTTVFGEEADWPERDLLNPGEFGQPAKYGEYVFAPLTTDNGGVHHNSGILNRALTLAILGGPGVTAAGAGPVTSLLLSTLRDVPYAFSTNLEEFSVTLATYCRTRARAGAVAGSVCASLEAGFADAALLRFQLAGS